jgi:hypothetical protein
VDIAVTADQDRTLGDVLDDLAAGAPAHQRVSSR